MSENNNSKKSIKLNKKGFTLVELLCTVAIIAIMTPVLIEGFTQAAKLNYRSRLQQRADAAANEIYEGISSVKYEELENYLSSLNGWTAIEDNTGEEYEYYVSKYYDELEDCEVKVAVQKYSESYIVPDLNFVGVKSKYLTLASEINALDGIAVEKLEQAIKSDETVKLAVKQDIVNKIRDKYGVNFSVSQINGSKILIDCGEIDETKISKETSVTVGVSGNNFVADYNTKYRYPASVANPDLDLTSSLVISYSYAFETGGRWVSVSNNSLDVVASLREYYSNSSYKFQFYMNGASESVVIDAEKDENGLPVSQTLFVYYNPFSEYDWVSFKNNNSSSDLVHKIFFIEQTKDDESFLKLGNEFNSSENNFKFSGQPVKHNEYTQLTQDSNKVDVYSNNPYIAVDGIPNEIYESTEREASMYRVEVSVTYQSTVFANVSGNFQAGGGTVDKYVG